MKNNLDSTWTKLLTELSTDDLNTILYNWNESEISADGNDILIFVDSRAYGPRTGGASVIDKNEFINWLMSEQPFDESIYGKDISNDQHWVNLINSTRKLIEHA